MPELKLVVRNLGLLKSNALDLKAMDDKLKYVEKNTDQLMLGNEQFESDLGIPISHSARAVVPYTKQYESTAV